MRQYRYRTPALTGPWRDTHDSAVCDAVRAKQATADRGEPDGVRWIVPGEIEERATDVKPTRLRG